MAEQIFPLERILTVSARDYCDSVGRSLSDYEMRGIHIAVEISPKRSETADFLYYCHSRNLPRAEVVVDPRWHQVNGYTLYFSCTALIPKSPKRRETQEIDNNCDGEIDDDCQGPNTC